MRSLVLSLALSLCFLSGCWGDETLVFPPGLEPVAVNEASFPAPQEGDAFPEQLEVVRTIATTAARMPPSVHARGYVHAPLTVVWEALRNPDVSADRRSFASYTVMQNVEPEYDFSYAVVATINNVITFSYTTTFRHGVVEGTVEAPQVIAEVWSKTEGSSIISELRGSIIARAVTPEVTSLEMIQFSRTPMSNHADNEAYLRQVYTDVVALSHGLPLPAVR
jgi:hypothetical protein